MPRPWPRFLAAKRLLTGTSAELGAKLRELWFTLYSRGGRILGSSGFEHVFLGEKKAGKVQGLHSWVFLHHLEQRGQVDYLLLLFLLLLHLLFLLLPLLLPLLLLQVNYLGHWASPDLGPAGRGLSFTFK